MPPLPPLPPSHLPFPPVVVSTLGPDPPEEPVYCLQPTSHFPPEEDWLTVHCPPEEPVYCLQPPLPPLPPSHLPFPPVVVSTLGPDPPEEPVYCLQPTSHFPPEEDWLTVH